MSNTDSRFDVAEYSRMGRWDLTVGQYHVVKVFIMYKHHVRNMFHNFALKKKRKLFKNLTKHRLKIILLYYQNNYVECFNLLLEHQNFFM